MSTGGRPRASSQGARSGGSGRWTAAGALLVVAGGVGLWLLRDARTAEAPTAKRVTSAAEESPRGAADPAAPAEVAGEAATAPPSAAPSRELLATLRACMSARELRPDGREIFSVAADGRVLEDCLDGDDPREVLRELAAVLGELEGADQESGIRLVAYLARALLDGAPSAGEKAEILAPVLEAYRSLGAPGLSSAVAQLLSAAYHVGLDDKRGAAEQLGLALERELEAGPADHILGPLLQATQTARIMRPSIAALDPEDPRSPRREVEAMEAVAERAIPVGLELGLARVAPGAEPRDLRDGLYLLQDVFLAGSRDSAQLLQASPGILDALGALDARDIERSGVARRPLYTLLAQTERRLREAGALDENGVPFGGHTAPAELRQRFGIPAPPPGVRLVTPGAELLQPLGPR